MELIRCETADGVAVVTLDDPERRNAISLTMVDEIVETFDRIEADPDVGAVIVTGEGRGFCAGADLGTLSGGGDGSVGAVYEGFLRIARSPLPTIAAVNGAAVGAGMNLALCCDLRIASQRARFLTRFLELGLHPGGGHTWMLRRAVGPHAAAAMLFFEETIDADTALRTGLVWAVTPPEELLDVARGLAGRAASYPREVVALVKRNLATMANVAEHDVAVAVELQDQLWTLNQPFFAERLAAMSARISR